MGAIVLEMLSALIKGEAQKMFTYLSIDQVLAIPALKQIHLAR